MAECNGASTFEVASVKAPAVPEQGLKEMSLGATFSEGNAALKAGELPPMPKYSDLVANTPMIELTQMVPPARRTEGVRVFAKCEFFNPGFSIKDRIVQHILDQAEADGRLKKGMTVVAASSGNTGASTAMMCAMRGYNCIITTSTKCSKEKMDAIRAYGARLLVSPPGVQEDHPFHYMRMAQTLVARNPGWFDINQYDTQDNPAGHYRTLGPEIWKQTNGCVTHFVAAGSTGGTVSGTGRYLKEQNPNITVALADPVGSIFTEYFKSRKISKPQKFLVEGVGKGSIPGAMHFDVIDKVLPVTDSQAFAMCAQLARTQGICAGGSSGLNVFAALQLAEQMEEPATIVTILCDLGVKYLSKVYNNDWLQANGMQAPPEPHIKGNFDLE